MTFARLGLQEAHLWSGTTEKGMPAGPRGEPQSFARSQGGIQHGRSFRKPSLSQTYNPARQKAPFEWPEPSIPRPQKITRQDILKATIVPSSDPDAEDVDYLQLILNARVYDVAIESPLQLAKNLSRKTGNWIYFKREDMQQPLFSFKLRGAFNRIFQLNQEQRSKGVICVSAGNHAQGVALAAKKLKIPAIVVMPTSSPNIKRDATRSLGAQVVVSGADFDEAKAEMFRMAEELGCTVISPFDDPYVIAGTGTIAQEIMRQLQQDQLHAVFVCIGGGGLLSGVLAYIKRVRPDVRVIGVNHDDSAGMLQSILAQRPVKLDDVGQFADGAAVGSVGHENYRLVNALVDDIVLVNTDELCAAIKDVFNDTRSILEPAGALAVAGCKKYLNNNPQIRDGVFVTILSGANMNFDRLGFVADRAKMGEGRECLLSVVIPEKPGCMKKLYQHIRPRNITELSYRFSDKDKAYVFLSVEIMDRAEIETIVTRLEGAGMPTLDLTDNEMAKAHARYLVGGHVAPGTVEERAIRFELPERAEAMERFMSKIESSWNLSLFHYKNHGGDLGKVLVGLQVPPEDEEKFQEFLENLGFKWEDESSNPVYKHFLK